MSDLDEFAAPVDTGMRRVVRDEDASLSDDLLDRLAEFEAVRNRGAVEARSAWISSVSRRV